MHWANECDVEIPHARFAWKLARALGAAAKVPFPPFFWGWGAGELVPNPLGGGGGGGGGPRLFLKRLSAPPVRPPLSRLGPLCFDPEPMRSGRVTDRGLDDPLISIVFL